MVREFGSADRVAEDNEAKARQLILDIARWPEQEQVWDAGHLDEAGTDDDSKSDDIEPEEFRREYARWEEVSREDARSDQAQHSAPGRGEPKRKQAKLDEAWRGFKPEDIGLDDAWRERIKFKRDQVQQHDEIPRDDVKRDEAGRERENITPPRGEPEARRDDVNRSDAGREDDSLVRLFGPGRDEPVAARPAKFDTNPAASPFSDIRAYQEEGPGYSAAKIAGGAIAGLLIVSGGIYAYQFLSRPPPAAHAVATAQPASPVPASQPAPNPEPAPLAAPAGAGATTPRSVPPPLRTTPDNASPPPSRAANNVVTSSRPRELDPNDTINAPMTLTPETAPPPQDPSLQMRPPPVESPSDASHVANGAGLRSPETRDPISAPMTLTPETAPPAQPQSAPRPAAQQPVFQPAR